MEYFKELELSLDEAQKFLDWYDSVGWKVKGGNPIKDWKACARQWKRRNKQNKHDKKGFNPGNFTPDAALLTDNSLRIKPREAWVEGTNIRTAVNITLKL